MSENINELRENSSLQEEMKSLKQQVVRLERELKTTKVYLSNATQAMAAKDALGKALANANAKQKSYTDMLLGNCPNIILLLDNDGKFVLSSAAFLKSANIHNFDFIKNSHYKEVFSDYISGVSFCKLEDAITTVARTRDSVVIDDWIDFPEIGSRYYSIEVSAGNPHINDKDEAIFGIVVVFTDLTDFMREKQRAEDASNAKSDFLATMSHEIRTPMNAILGMSEMLSRSEMNGEQRGYLSDIRKSSQSLLAIINDILDFSKVEAGRMDLVRTNFSLQALLDNLHSVFSHMFKTKGLDFGFEIDDGFPGSAYGDENRLRQILTNLLSNALKYTAAGSVTLRAYMNENQNINFEIADTGIGIKEEDKSRLFTPFEQLDLIKNKNTTGTGLGLAISHNLCKLMGGSLRLESVYGEGSTFYAEIPFIPAGDNTAAEVVEHGEFLAPGASVLVVDDIEINLNVVEAMLSLFEIVPDTATNGFEAIKASNMKKYDIIFMDHMMPELDGIEATKIIRANCKLNNDSVIVALTANAINGMEETFLSNGFDGFLSKPLEFLQLNICLRKWLPAELIVEES